MFVRHAIPLLSSLITAAFVLAPADAHADCPTTSDGVGLSSNKLKASASLEKTESLRFADVDADGSDDLCYASGYYVFCYTHRHLECDYGGDVYGCSFDPENDPDCGFGNHRVQIFFPFSLTSKLSYVNSLSFADIDDDGDLDACARGADGVYCAENRVEFGVPTHGNMFGTSGLNQPDATLWDSGFKDVHGWSQAQYGDTVKFVDVNNDGKADVCGRGSAGVYCHFSNGSSFSGGGLLTHGKDFGNDDIVSAIPEYGVGLVTDFDWGSAAGYYGTIDFVDVNGDDYLDVCGRSSNGVYCSEFNIWTGRFNSKRRYLSNQFLDVHGWDQPQYGTTVQFGDVNGDGDVDVCGRGTGHLFCGLGDPGARKFEGANQIAGWGVFTDAQGWDAENRYSTMVLTDFNGDGADDFCGRGPNGLYCSYGATVTWPYLSGMYRVISNFGDNFGWGAKEQYWGSVQPANVNGLSAGNEFCGVGDAGVHCSD